MTYLKPAGALLASMLLVACKVQITVPEGGRVVSESGTYSCEAGQTCEIDIADTLFNERFVAQAAEGFVFDKWKRAQAHFCGDQNNNCPISTVLLASYPEFLSFLDADLLYYLEPEFVPQQTGGAAWLYETRTCVSFSGGADLSDEGPNAESFGVLEGEYSVEEQDCSDYETYAYEISPTTGERRLKTISPPIGESAQCPTDPRCGDVVETTQFNYVELSRQGVAVERLKSIDSYTNVLGFADDNVGIDESIVLGYEPNLGSEGRLISYEEWTLKNDERGEQPSVTVEYAANWNYEPDGSVSEVSTTTLDPELGTISGRIRYQLEGGGLAAYTEAEIFGETYTLGKKVFHDRGTLDALTLGAPPTGQVETENDWVLPENFTEYQLDFDSNTLVETWREEIVRSSVRGYPLEVIEYALSEESGEMEPIGRSLYGYRTDAEGTVYRRVVLTYEWNSEGGRWVRSTAFINKFRSDPLIIRAD